MIRKRARPPGLIGPLFGDALGLFVVWHRSVGFAS